MVSFGLCLSRQLEIWFSPPIKRVYRFSVSDTSDKYVSIQFGICRFLQSWSFYHLPLGKSCLTKWLGYLPFPPVRKFLVDPLGPHVKLFMVPPGTVFCVRVLGLMSPTFLMGFVITIAHVVVLTVCWIKLYRMLNYVVQSCLLYYPLHKFYSLAVY